MEKERDRESENQEENDEEEITYDVTILNDNKGKIRLKRGATLQDLIDELIRLGYLKSIKGLTIMLDGRVIKYNPETGELSENPILSRNGALSIMGKIKGGSC